LENRADTGGVDEVGERPQNLGEVGLRVDEEASEVLERRDQQGAERTPEGADEVVGEVAEQGPERGEEDVDEVGDEPKERSHLSEDVADPLGQRGEVDLPERVP
jgi:hypothetical protein